jgi:5-methylcytosine-specific restriction endonuclease McrA
MTPEQLEATRARQRAWRERNKEKLRADKLAYYLANKEREDARVRQWREANRARVRGYWRDWYASDLDHARAQAINSQARRRARTRGAGVTRSDWHRIKAEYGHRCAYCGTMPQRLEQEHVDPIASGGPHDPANVVPACRRCNAGKNDDTLLMGLAR